VNTDYASFTLDAPLDPRLPGGGGYPILVYLPRVTTAAQQFLTRESRYGDDGKERNSYYDGVNVNVNARMSNGLFVSLGTQTGRRVDDRCHVVQNFNNGAVGPNPRGCRDAAPFQTTVRGLASYMLPKVDVLVSATFRSQPPLELDAGWAVPNSLIESFTGDLPQLTATGNTTVQLLDSDHRLYVDNRRTQIDMRFAKVLRLFGTRTDVGVDLWNLLNTNYATGYEDTYDATWGNPTSIYAPRFVRLNFTINF
jgi:hypothetical protein